MAKNISFDDLRKAMLFHRIVEWKDNYIRLDNGMELRIEETAQDCLPMLKGSLTMWFWMRQSPQSATSNTNLGKMAIPMAVLRWLRLCTIRILSVRQLVTQMPEMVATTIPLLPSA